MNNQQVAKQTAAHVMQTYGRLPIALVRGEGVRVWDADGKSYLDFLSGLGVNNVGHRHPRVTEALRDASLLHCSNLYHIPQQAALAERLTELSGLARAFFCNSGAEANEAAIKLARRYAHVKGEAQRCEIITAQSSFHGRTLATVAATGQPRHKEGFAPLPDGFRHVPLNDLAALEAAVTHETCAVMLEPVQGEGGVHPCTTEYLQGVRRLCDERGILLILDEVQTGIGRTGTLFAFEHFGIRPDVLTLAKALGGGVPIGAMLADEQAAQGLAPGTHASTFGGNPLAAGAALAVLDAIADEGLLAQATESGRLLQEGLKALARRYPHALGEVRGLGLMIGVALKMPGEAVLEGCQSRGLLVNVLGGATLRLLPPLIIGRAEIEEALSILESVIKERAGVCQGETTSSA